MTTTPLFVVHASVGAKAVLPEPERSLARRLFDAAGAGLITLLAPETYVGEVTNTLWKRRQLTGDLTREQAERGLRVILGMLPVLVPVAPLAEQALQLALAFRRPVYDCLYVALSQQQACPLVTADLRLVGAMGAAMGNILTLEDAARRLS